MILDLSDVELSERFFMLQNLSLCAYVPHGSSLLRCTIGRCLEEEHIFYKTRLHAKQHDASASILSLIISLSIFRPHLWSRYRASFFCRRHFGLTFGLNIEPHFLAVCISASESASNSSPTGRQRSPAGASTVTYLHYLSVISSGWVANCVPVFSFRQGRRQEVVLCKLVLCYSQCCYETKRENQRFASPSKENHIDNRLYSK